jgi:hypothetical protein
MMIRPLLVSLLVCAAAASSSAQGSALQLPQASPAATLKQRVGLTDVQIEYSRPGVKGRQVFGDLEPYGKVWRTGANAATKITFSAPVNFGGVDVPAGTYGLFSIPGASEWTVILNEGAKDWGAYSYDEKKDVARVKTTAVRLAEDVETFTIDLNDLRDDSATLNLIWQRTRVPVKLRFNTVPVVLQQIDEAMKAEKITAGTYDSAALFYLDHNLDLAKASEWIGKAIADQPNAFYFHYHQARILAKKGDKEGAIAAARKSIELAAKSSNRTAADEYKRLNEQLIAQLQ